MGVEVSTGSTWKVLSLRGWRGGSYDGWRNQVRLGQPFHMITTGQVLAGGSSRKSTRPELTDLSFSLTTAV